MGRPERLVRVPAWRIESVPSLVADQGLVVLPHFRGYSRTLLTSAFTGRASRWGSRRHRGTSVGEPRPGNDPQRLRRTTLLRVDALREPPQAVRSLFHGPCTQLDLECGPTAVCYLHHSVDLQVRVVLEVQYLRIAGLGMDPQIPDDQGLEQEAQEVQILEQPRRSSSKL